MSYRMLVTTFSQDLKQFKMFCHCLAKNWQGRRDLIVCLGNNDNIEELEQITKSTFDFTWNIDIKPTLHSYVNGTTEQQVNAVWYSINSAADDVIIWDCKDFLLRPADLHIFKKNDKYRITYILAGKKLIEMGYDVSGLVDKPIAHLTAISNIRPWIWNVEQLNRYWHALVEKFGDYKSWDDYPAGNEIYGYYVFAMNDTARTIKFLNYADTPLLFAGGYTFQTYDAMVNDMKDFDDNEQRIVWKHSRKLQDPRCLDITRIMLIKYGVDPEFVDSVYGPSDLIPA